MGSFKPQPRHSLSHIKEKLQGKILGLSQQTAELAHLAEPFTDGVGLGGETDPVYHLLAQHAETMLLEQSSHLVKSYLRFKVLRVNHGAKVLLFQLLSSKSSKNICTIQKIVIPLQPKIKVTVTIPTKERW